MQKDAKRAVVGIVLIMVLGVLGTMLALGGLFNETRINAAAGILVAAGTFTLAYLIYKRIQAEQGRFLELLVCTDPTASRSPARSGHRQDRRVLVSPGLGY